MAEKTTERNAQEAYMKYKKISKADIRIVLIGKSGCGKSETANNIIGEKRFETDMSAESVTQICHSETAMVLGKRLTVVDTPGIFDPNANIENTQREIAKFIELTLPGPHAVLLVTQIGRITEEDKQTLQKFKRQFGPAILDRMIFVFTHYDQWKRTNKPFNEYVSSAAKSFPILKQYSDRYVAFENVENGLGGDEQVLKLLNLVERVIAANGGECYTNDMYITRLNEIEDERRRLDDLEKSRLDKEKQEQRLKEKAAEEKGRKNANRKRKKENYKLKKKIQEIEREKDAEIERQKLAAIKEAEERGRKQAEKEFKAKELREREEKERQERQREDEKRKQQLESERKEAENERIKLLDLARLKRNQFKELVLKIDYAVVCGIEIRNNSKYMLHSPEILMEKGVVHTPPLTIMPNETGTVITHKFPFSAFGTTGIVKWKIDNQMTNVLVMWSLPFIPFEIRRCRYKVVCSYLNMHDILMGFLERTPERSFLLYEIDMLERQSDIVEISAEMKSEPKTVLKCTLQDKMFPGTRWPKNKGHHLFLQ